MPTQAALSSEFSPVRLGELAKAGTVALPSPPPAVGKLFIIRNDDTNSVLAEEGLGSPQYILKLVQTVVKDLREVTRYLALSDLRAINIPDPTANGLDPKRQTFPVEKIADKIEAAIDDLTSAKNGCDQERLLLDDVVIYVGDTAPVLVRLVSYYGVTAAEAAENIVWGGIDDPCC